MWRTNEKVSHPALDAFRVAARSASGIAVIDLAARIDAVLAATSENESVSARRLSEGNWIGFMEEVLPVGR